MSPLLVSIVTPAFNQGEFLEATMLSVLTQDYPALEYIVINDGSTDQSLAVAQSVAARFPGRVRVIDQPNAGQAATLNRGWQESRGDILAYLSSDDCLVPDAVSRMVQALEAQPQAAVAYCDFWLIDAEGRRLRESYTEAFDHDRLRASLVCQPGPGAFFRRRVFERQGGWRPELRQVPDFEFWLRASREGGFVRVPQLLAEYRIHEGSASFRAMPPERAEEIVKVVQAYWSDQPGTALARRALARAHAIAAKNHGQSGRPGEALRAFFRALRLQPSMAGELGIWRQLLVGMLRRRWYQWRAALGGS
ncbi:glycosyltransferase family 2 protein [Roseateles sp. DB2]|uniref:glycosyltransferase family 2 protein n=1 Tax=Roseateles sp. DB2 TaxID=3453717 RepID=UPI003EEA2A1D